MPSRDELLIRAAAIGLDSQPAKYQNDSLLEQAVIYAEKNKTPGTAAVAATTTLTSNGTNVTAGDTISIAGRTYTFVAALDNATPNQILIGASASATLDNVKAALSPAQAGQGTTWSYPTIPLSEVVTGTKTATTLVITARNTGIAGNSIPTTKVAATLSFTGATMAGGVVGTGPNAQTLAALSGGANV